MNKKTVTKEIMAKRLKGLMEANNETTYTMAERFGLTSPTISRYMTGQMAPKITAINAIAEYFGVNSVWLMGYDEPKYLNEASHNEHNIPEIMKYYNTLNPTGQAEATKRVYELTQINEYTNIATETAAELIPYEKIVNIDIPMAAHENEGATEDMKVRDLNNAIKLVQKDRT